MAEFLVQILDFVPEKRPTAAQCLNHPWISAGPKRLTPSISAMENGCANKEEKGEREAVECLAKPMEPQYSGGMVLNPELEHGLNGWTPFGDAKLEHQESENGNKYIVSHGKAHITAIFKTKVGELPVGWVMARQGCWSMLKGDIIIDASSPVELFFQVHKIFHFLILQDSISLQSVTQEEWDSHQDQSIEKRQVKFQVVDSQGLPFENAKISVKQIQQTFPFGNAVSKFILENKAYQELFLSGFKYSVFDNEMKWYSTEKGSGKVNYSESDTMLEFAKENNILVRGHNTLWDDPRYQPSWVKRLPRKDLPLAAKKRMKSIMKQYSGQVFHSDVINENLHFSYYEERMGRNASTTFLQMAHQIDQKAIPFLNNYSTLKPTPAMYLEKIKLIREQGYHGPLGIGLESHFDTPNLPYVRASLDMLASTKLPIWITELDALYLTQLIKEFHTHPAIHDIIMWGSMSTKGCWKMCFTDKNFSNLPTGNALDNIMKVWRHEGFASTTDAYGYFNTSLFHGDYEVEIRHTTTNYSKIRQFGMEPSEKIQEAHFKFHE
ncbi:endo-1,4-beta-xylanase A-like [Olea europaea subsp. europaea]|uniref:Endo-1,4-beta-xylanase A-like n=1 Tax=Olea europaea subsp. europaea TaxID=158383 RepID=A0A8S0T035_OLEEU|nr:endo-1,4-beta-xylanase A-like [Olea europaea subsp. europaea]